MSGEFQLAFDGGILQFRGFDKNKIYEISEILKSVNAELICLYGADKPLEFEKPLQELSATNRPLRLIKNTTNCGKLHMNELSQIVLVLECIA